MRYLITTQGCDDSTHSLVELTDEQAEGLRIASAAINERAVSCCMPRLRIKNESDSTASEIESATEGVPE